MFFFFECQDLYTAGAEGQDAGPSLDYMMHLNMTMNQPHLQLEEVLTKH